MLLVFIKNGGYKKVRRQKKIRNCFNLKNQQRGQGLIEYVILVAIIAVASIGILRTLGHVTSTQLANVTLALQGKSARKIQSSAVQESLYKKKDLSDFTRNSSENANQ